MAMNYERYDYPEAVGYTNVVCQRTKGSAATRVVEDVINPKLVPFLDALIAARPHWKFVATRPNGTILGPNGNSVFAWSYLDIYEHGEQLGEIDFQSSYRDGENVIYYCFDNHRLAAKRQRGSWTRTSKLEKAVKDVLKTFRPRDISEQVAQRMEAVESLVSRATNNERRLFDSAWGHVTALMVPTIMRNWTTIAAMLEEDGVKFDQGIPDLYRRRNMARRAFEAVSRDSGVTIIVRQNDYIMVQEDPNQAPNNRRTTKIVTSENLPDEVRRKLGMLKLTEVNQYLPDLGMRCKEDTYFIVLGETE